MATIGEVINQFIVEHELDADIYDSMTELFTKCMELHARFVINEPVPEKAKKDSVKASKADKIEDPTVAQSRDELRNCTTGVLNEFCKTTGLKVGGNKKEIMDRVWRHIQGESSDDDKSPKSKPKKVKVVAEKHACFGCNAKGAPCAIAATEEVETQWFCWRHVSEASDIIASKNQAPAASESSKSAKTKKKVVVADESGDENPEPEVKKGKVKKAVKKIETPTKPDSESELEEEE